MGRGGGKRRREGGRGREKGGKRRREIGEKRERGRREGRKRVREREVKDRDNLTISQSTSLYNTLFLGLGDTANCPFSCSPCFTVRQSSM